MNQYLVQTLINYKDWCYNKLYRMYYDGLSFATEYFTTRRNIYTLHSSSFVNLQLVLETIFSHMQPSSTVKDVVFYWGLIDELLQTYEIKKNNLANIKTTYFDSLVCANCLLICQTNTSFLEQNEHINSTTFAHPIVV